MSLEANKIAGAILLAGVITMTAGFIGDMLVPDHNAAHEGEEAKALAYPLPEGVGEASAAAEASAEPEVLAPILPLLASADPVAGEGQFKKCTACHNALEGGRNATGPNLWDVIGRPIASHEGFTYAGLAEKAGQNWTYENLNAFLHAPKQWAPGTKMNFKGIPGDQDRANLIAYLRAQSPSPKPLEPLQ